MGFRNCVQFLQLFVGLKLFQNKKVKKECPGMILNGLEFLCWQEEDNCIPQDSSYNLLFSRIFSFTINFRVLVSRFFFLNVFKKGVAL